MPNMRQLMASYWIWYNPRIWPQSEKGTTDWTNAFSLDIRFCDIVQRNLIAVYVPSSESMHGVMNGQSGFRTALSMFVEQ